MNLLIIYTESFVYIRYAVIKKNSILDYPKTFIIHLL